MNHKWIKILFPAVFIALTGIFIYPIFQGLILLPLDLLVSNYAPWLLANTILLKNPFMQDSVIQMFPWRHLTYESLTSGVLPFWNPFQFLGMPFMAGGKSLVFYPANIFFFFGEIRSWHILLAMQLLGSMSFMYMFVREFRISKIAALLSAITYSLNTLMIGVLVFGSEGQVLMWVPLFLYFVKRFIDEGKGRHIFLLGITLATSIFAGHLQYLMYGLIALVSFIFVYGGYRKTSLKIYLVLLFTIILGFGISSIQLIPSIELFQLSYRGIVDSFTVFAGGLLKPFQLFRLLAPDFFGHPMTRDLQMGYIEQSGYFGIVPLFFGIYASINLWKNKIVRYFTLIAALGIILSFDGIGQILYFLHIPLLTSGYGGRIFFLVYLGFSILSGFGMMSFFKAGNLSPAKRYSIWFGGVTASVFLFFLAFPIHFSFTPVFGNIKFSVIVFLSLSVAVFGYLFILRKMGNRMIMLLMIGLVLLSYFDVFRMGYRFLTFSNSKFLYPATPVIDFLQSHTKGTLGRVYGIGDFELPSYLGIQSLETYHPLYPMRTGRFFNSFFGIDENVMPINKYTLPKNNELKKVLDITGTEYVVMQKDQNPSIEYFRTDAYSGDFPKVFSDDRFDVYENKGVLPRFGLYYDIIDGLGEEQILNLMKSPGIDLKRTVLLEETIGIKFTEGTGSAELVSANVNSLMFRVTTDRQGVLLLTDAWFPGWNATINGTETKIYRANYMFRAVIIPAGVSDVTFKYLPSQFVLAGGFTLVSVLALTILSFVSPKRKGKKQR